MTPASNGQLRVTLLPVAHRPVIMPRALANLADFAIELPACSVETTLFEGIALCAKHQSEWLLVLNAQQQPQGAMRLVQLLSRWQECRTDPGLEPSPSSMPPLEPLLMGYQGDLLYPISWMGLDQSLDHLWPQLFKSPHRLYGGQDEAGSYYLLDRESILAWTLQSRLQSWVDTDGNGSASLDRSSMGPQEVDWQLIVDRLILPASIENRGGLIACNQPWGQTFAGKGGLPSQFPAWQFHRLPLRAGPETAAADPASGELWLVVASPDGPDTTVLNGWLAGVSHELKSPITSLLGLSTLLMDERLGQLNPKQHHYVDLVHQTVRRLNTTINHLLDWVRLDSGQLSLHPTRVDVRSLWPEVLQQIHEQGLGPAIDQLQTIDWFVAPEVQTVMADSLRLRQILAHLISYCLSRSDGQCRCTGRVEAWGHWVGLTISDPSVLPASQRSRLFHPQGFSSGLSRLELGPALAWHLVRLHGGDITFTSSVEAGSRFTVLLPRAEAAADSVLLLLVADDGAIADRVIQALAQGRARVAIAHSLSEAVDKTHRLQPAVLLVAAETLTERANPVAYLRQRLGAFPPVLPLASQAVADDGVAIESLGYPLPAPLQTALDLTAEQSLTVLHLCANLEHASGSPVRDIGSWLRRYHCRVLEVDDPFQADLLSRVWQPDVVVLDTDFPNSRDCIGQISELAYLRRCPLVVLTAAAAAAAAEFPQLRWRAYLSPHLAASALGLMQVIREAIAIEES
ncbi:hypothetical protein C7271_10585 [filamentous cyanobacterium CCP5]|nr:hypothetical protein C7271_10585 [filamentous cyanobacterium CCP5]